MSFRLGTYDNLAAQLREVASARGVVLLVIDGAHGTGFSQQIATSTDPSLAAAELELVVETMRLMADAIEADAKDLRQQARGKPSS